MPDANLTVSTAAVATDRPGRYGKQLVAHLSRRADGEWSEDSGTGWINFDGARAVLDSGAGVLTLRLKSTSDNLARFEKVLGEHLVRFGARDELIVRWLHADGSPGTTQQHPGD